MLLALDAGNTNTVLGVFREKKLVANWRLTTARDQTIDEYGILTRNLFTLAELEPREIGGVIISSVVPPLNSTLAGMARALFRPQGPLRRAGNQDRDARAIRQPAGSGRRPHRQ